MNWNDYLRIEIYAIIFAFIIIQQYTYRRRKKRSPKLTSSPILLAYYTYNSDLLPANRGKLAGLEYNSIAVVPKDGAAFKSCAIIHIKLPYMTNVHLLGIPKSAGGTNIDPTAYGSVMEEVVLEGDYPSYFNLYADKGQQFESRYVLDPGAMWYTVEFCQSHNWEIVKGDLYFVQETEMKHETDTTNMWQDIRSFVDKIRPAVEVPNYEDKRKELSRAPRCPVCIKQLNEEEDSWTCPKGHGILIKGSILTEKLRAGRITMSKQKELINENPRKMLCPACDGLMLKENFKTAYAKIDRCTACEYNWLDSVDLSQKTLQA